MLKMSENNATLDRIQKEIKESIDRDNELRKLYNSNEKIVNLNNGETNNNEVPVPQTNGFKKNEFKTKVNKVNGVRLFAQNPSRGLMQAFFKSRGKTSGPMKSQPQTNGIPEPIFEPAKVTVEKGKPIRKGFVSAEEKMKQELLDFQKREEELRKERRKSQPNIMAALDLEDDEEREAPRRNTLKSAKSMSNLYNGTDDSFLENHSAPCSLKPSKSTMLLCDMSDYRDEIPGTYTLIRQFESLKSQDRS